MAKAVGLMNPDNAVKSQGQFKQGFVRIDSNSYKVHKGEGQQDAVPATKWSWKVTRLQENGINPLLDEHDMEIQEELLFSFGTKSLPFVHPGQASGPDDDPDDQGTDVGAEGNTIYLNAPDWKPNNKSGLVMLTASLSKLTVNPMYLNRCWTADWNGCVFHMQNVEGEKGSDGRTFNYKVVTKIQQGPGGKKGGKANGAPAVDAVSVLAPLISKLSTELAGQTLTRKAFQNRIKGLCDATGVPAQMLVPVLSAAKDEKVLAEYAETFDYTINSDGITFGSMTP